MIGAVAGFEPSVRIAPVEDGTRIDPVGVRLSSVVARDEAPVSVWSAAGFCVGIEEVSSTMDSLR
jgi:hypothetical protein